MQAPALACSSQARSPSDDAQQHQRATRFSRHGRSAATPDFACATETPAIQTWWCGPAHTCGRYGRLMLTTPFSATSEGTVSAISFVKDVLYPYAVERLTTLAHDSWSDPAFQELVAGFPDETRPDAATLLAHVEDLTRRDVKAVYLKQLQGNLWKTGYSKGELKTPLFDDVIPTLEAWKNAGKTLAIFSSGSVQAQLQFFTYVDDGLSTRDLKPLFSAHFDTVTAGSKLEKESYVKICRELGVEVGKATFLTDNVNEAVAATKAGVHTIIVDRPGNAPLSPKSRAEFAIITSLTELA